ncbi:unnamed protein product [Hydatigera taeniaeformis]|uniref:Secreted protein n=1 Tax=Hydatigena taeniaeformis TaxID=6205 RepID=A0A3P7EG50_HYDTA|nr:unnamed protein product [Hydatigera taeniaeformis]
MSLLLSYIRMMRWMVVVVVVAARRMEGEEWQCFDVVAPLKRCAISLRVIPMPLPICRCWERSVPSPSSALSSPLVLVSPVHSPSCLCS